MLNIVFRPRFLGGCLTLGNRAKLLWRTESFARAFTGRESVRRLLASRFDLFKTTLFTGLSLFTEL